LSSTFLLLTFNDSLIGSDYVVLLLDTSSQIQKIPNRAQFVLVGQASVAIYKVFHDGYTIPYQVEFGHKLEPNSKVCIAKDNYDESQQWYEKINGKAPYDYSSRMLYTRQRYALMRTHGILTANKGETFSFGRFEGTEWKEYTVRADKRFFTKIGWDSGRGQGMLNVTVERTMNGYFKVKFSNPPTGYCYINNTVVEFVESADGKVIVPTPEQIVPRTSPQQPPAPPVGNANTSNLPPGTNIIDLRYTDFDFDSFVNFAVALGNDTTFHGGYSYSVVNSQFNGNNSKLTMLIDSRFTSPKADEVSFPRELGVTGNVVNNPQILELSVEGNEDSIRELAGNMGNYRALIWFKNFRHNRNTDTFSAEVLKIEIIKKVR